MHEEEFDNQQNILDIKDAESMIDSFTKKTSLYGFLYKVIKILHLLTPILLFMAIFGVNIFLTIGITILSIIATKYLTLRCKTLYYINFYALEGFNQYKESLIKLEGFNQYKESLIKLEGFNQYKESLIKGNN